MNQLGQKLRDLREESGYTIVDVARHISLVYKPVTNKSVGHWEKGESVPNAYQFLHLCKLYGVHDLKVFIKEQIIEKRPRLNVEGNRKVKEYVRVLEASGLYSTEEPAPETRMMRLYRIPASAGTGQFLDGEQYEMVEVDATVPQSADFGIRIAGDSMEPRFTSGQAVWVHGQQTLEDGEIGVFSINGDAYIKKLSRADGVHLVSFNKSYEPIPVTETDDLQVFGRVVGG